MDLRATLFTLALLLLALDTLAGLWLGGFLRGPGRLARGRAAPAALVLAAILGAGLLVAAPPSAFAQVPAANRPNGTESALNTRLAYVVTGDSAVDSASRTGLTGLTRCSPPAPPWSLASPGLDPEKDELAFYPLIYWPIVAGRPQPSEAAIRKIDAFMRNGGTVIFDTRDAQTAPPAARRRRRPPTCARCSPPWRCRNSSPCRRTTC